MSRRDRVRAATLQEITQTARRILVENGPQAVTLRAIAREMGMTAPALYRYFDSHEELIRNVIAEIFIEVADDMQRAIDEVDAVDKENVTAKFIACAREFRRWALDNKGEYGMLFGTPLPGLDMEHDDILAACSRRFGGTFLGLLLELWEKKPFPVPADGDIDPGLREQLYRYREGIGVTLPLGALLVFLEGWVRLHGIVSLEVFGHLGFALDDPAPMFDLMVADVAPRLGLDYPPAGRLT